MTRPSTRYAVIVSSVTPTWSMRDSTLTAVLIPCLDDDLRIRANYQVRLTSYHRRLDLRERGGRSPRDGRRIALVPHEWPLRYAAFSGYTDVSLAPAGGINDVE